MCKKPNIARALKKWLKLEQRRYRQRKKYCQKMYEDWEDNEFNYLDNKFVWAKVAEGSKPETPSFITLNDAIIYFDREAKEYVFDCDLSMFDCGDADSAQHMIEYLERIQDAFAAWYYEGKFDTTINEPYCEMFNHGIRAETLPMLKLQIDSLICGLQATLKIKHHLT